MLGGKDVVLQDRSRNGTFVNYVMVGPSKVFFFSSFFLFLKTLIRLSLLKEMSVSSGDVITFIAGEREYGFTLQILHIADEGEASFSSLYEMDSKVQWR